MTPKKITLIIYDIDGNEHSITISKKEAIDIIKSLVEAIS